MVVCCCCSLPNYIILKQWECDSVFVVDVSLMTFDAFTTGAEYAIPETSLLSVVMALSLSVAVVQVMVFDY